MATHYCNSPLATPDEKGRASCRRTIGFGAGTCGQTGHKIPSARWYPQGGAVKVRVIGRHWNWSQPGVLDESSLPILHNWQDHALAIAIAAELHTPLVFVANHNGVYAKKTWDEMRTIEGRLEDPQANLRWKHTAVQLGPDRYLDVDGVHTAAELIRAYRDKGYPNVMENGDVPAILVPTDAEQLRRLPYLSVWHAKVQPDFAGSFVEPVLNRFTNVL